MFTVIDGAYDEPASRAFPDLDEPAAATSGSTRRRPLATRWCALAAVLGVVALVLAGLQYRDRARPTVTTQLVAQPGRVSAQLSGCPTDRPCQYGGLTENSSMLPLVRQYLPRAEQLSSSVVFDGSSAELYRTLLVASLPTGVTLTVAVDLDPTTKAILPTWQSPLPAVGPADVELVRPGGMVGSSVSVAAHVPAGTAVPVDALRRLIADPNLFLG